MRREAVPSLVLCLIVAAALSTTLGHRHEPVEFVAKLVAIFGLLILGLSLALARPKPKEPSA
jgi:uncharacterized membrane protein YccC